MIELSFAPSATQLPFDLPTVMRQPDECFQ